MEEVLNDKWVGIEPPDDYIDFRRSCGVICGAEPMRFAQALSAQIAG